MTIGQWICAIVGCVGVVGFFVALAYDAWENRNAPREWWEDD
jgi:hypothetical protein